MSPDALDDLAKRLLPPDKSFRARVGRAAAQDGGAYQGLKDLVDVRPLPIVSKPLPEGFDPSWAQSTIGAFATGTIGTINMFQTGVTRIKRGLEGEEYDYTLDPSYNEAQRFFARHPEWNKPQTEGAWDFLTTPKALIGTGFETLPFMLGVAAATIGAGPAGAYGLATIVEGEGAYRSAIEKGASEDEARVAGVVTGTINGAIELFQVTQLMKHISPIATKQLAAAAIRKTIATGGKNLLKMPKSFVKLSALEGLEEVLQGANQEIAANLVADIPIEKGFLDRRAQEFIGGASAAAMFGGSGKIIAAPFERAHVKAQEADIKSFAEKQGIKLDKSQVKEVRESLEKIALAKQADELESQVAKAIEARKASVAPVMPEEIVDGLRSEVIEKEEDDALEAPSVETLAEPTLEEEAISSAKKETFFIDLHQSFVPDMSEDEFGATLRREVELYTIVWAVRNNKNPDDWYDTIEGVQRVSFEDMIESISEEQKEAFTEEFKDSTEIVAPYGSVSFNRQTGKALLSATKAATVEGALHELFHVFYRQLPRAEREKLYKAFAVEGKSEVFEGPEDPDYVFDYKNHAEERATNAFIRWHWSPSHTQVPVPMYLKKAFQQFRNWLRKIYLNLKGSGIDVPLSKSTQEVFASMFDITPEIMQSAQFQQLFNRMEALDRQEIDQGVKEVEEQVVEEQVVVPTTKDLERSEGLSIVKKGAALAVKKPHMQGRVEQSIAKGKKTSDAKGEYISHVESLVQSKKANPDVDSPLDKAVDTVAALQEMGMEVELEFSDDQKSVEFKIRRVEPTGKKALSPAAKAIVDKVEKAVEDGAILVDEKGPYISHLEREDTDKENDAVVAAMNRLQELGYDVKGNTAGDQVEFRVRPKEGTKDAKETKEVVEKEKAPKTKDTSKVEAKKAAVTQDTKKLVAELKAFGIDADLIYDIEELPSNIQALIMLEMQKGNKTFRLGGMQVVVQVPKVEKGETRQVLVSFGLADIGDKAASQELLDLIEKEKITKDTYEEGQWYLSRDLDEELAGYVSPFSKHISSTVSLNESIQYLHIHRSFVNEGILGRVQRNMFSFSQQRTPPPSPTLKETLLQAGKKFEPDDAPEELSAEERLEKKKREETAKKSQESLDRIEELLHPEEELKHVPVSNKLNDEMRKYGNKLAVKTPDIGFDAWVDLMVEKFGSKYFSHASTIWGDVLYRRFPEMSRKQREALLKAAKQNYQKTKPLTPQQRTELLKDGQDIFDLLPHTTKERWLDDMFDPRSGVSLEQLEDIYRELTGETPKELSAEVDDQIGDVITPDQKKEIDDYLAEQEQQFEDGGDDVEGNPDILYQAEPKRKTPRDKEREKFADIEEDTAVQKIVRGMQTLFDISAPLRGNEAGEKLLELFDNAHSYQLTIMGEFSSKIDKRYRALTKDDRKWIQQLNEDGISQGRLLVEEKLSAPNKELESWRELLKEINNKLGAEAERIGAVQKTQTGAIVPIKNIPDREGRLIRALTEEADWAVWHGSGKIYEGLVNAIERLNPDLKRGDVAKKIRDWRGNASIKERRIGMLEETRHIEVFPDAIWDGKKWIRIMETNPLRLAHRSLSLQSMRLGLIEQFGQAVVKNVGMGSLRSLAKTLGVGPVFNKEILRARILEHPGFDGDLDVSKMTMKELQKEAIKLEIPGGVTRIELVAAITSIDATKLSVNQNKALRKLARKIKGVPEELENKALLDALIGRVQQDLKPQYTKLKKEFVRGGGDEASLDLVFQVAQGIPIAKINRNPIVRWLNFISTVIGTGHVSQAFIPNISQTAALVPGFVGVRRFAQAVSAYHTRPGETRERIFNLGGADPGTLDKNFLDNPLGRHGLEDLGRLIRGVGGRVSLLKWATTRNNIIAGESFRLMADDWRSGGINESEMPIAESLRLSEIEIQQIQAKEMSDFTYAKIVQTGVAKTQFLTEASHRRGKLELHPTLKALYPYQNYGIGTMKASFEQFHNVWKAYKAKDNIALARSTKRLMGTLVRFMGVGMLTNFLRQIITRRPPRPEDDDKELWEKAFQGLLEVQFLGPTTRMLSSWQGRAGTVEGLALSMSPKVITLLETLALAVNTVSQASGRPGVIGRYRDFSAWEQSSKHVLKNVGLLRTTTRWMENSIYPDMNSFYETKREVRAYQLKRLDDLIQQAKTPEAREYHKRQLAAVNYRSTTPLNERYERVFQGVVHQDLAEATQATKDYYQWARKTGQDQKKIVQGLRSSLQSRAPLDLKDDEKLRFLSKLKKEERIKAWQAHTKYMRFVDHLAPKGSN